MRNRSKWTSCGLMVFLVLVLGGSVRGQEVETTESPDPIQLRYSPREGDEWEARFKRTFELDAEIAFDRSGERGKGRQKRNIQIQFSERIRTKTKVRRSSGDQFELRFRLLRYKLNVDVPVIQIKYDSRTDSSGIYHRIFGQLMDREFSLVLDSRGGVVRARGVAEMLSDAREQLPDAGGGKFFSALVDTLEMYLTKNVFISWLKAGWVQLPEKSLKCGERWKKKYNLGELFQMVDIGDFRIRSEYLLDDCSDGTYLIRTFPEASINEWKTKQKNRGKRSPGKMTLSLKEGVTSRKVNVALQGVEQNRGELLLQYDRTSSK